jgi:hypothetical protein
MNQRALAIAGLLFALIIGSMFAYSSMKRKELNNQVVTPVSTTPMSADTETMLVSAVHFFTAPDAHTIVGDISMPTPCDLLKTETQVRESAPEQVTIALTTVNNTTECATSVTTQRFRADFTASENASIGLTFDGKEVRLNLRDAEPGTTPEKLGDLYFKG